MFLDKVTYYNYEMLNVYEQDIYDGLCRGLSNYQAEISLDSCDKDSLSKVFMFVLYDHPEIFWASGGYSYTVYPDHVTVRPKYTISASQKTKLSNKLNDTVSKIIRGAYLMDGLYEMVLYCHDYIVSHSEYDLKAKDKPSSNVYAGTAYGCLVEGKAVCAGYAKAFQLLLQKLGIGCGYISGVLHNGGRHAWNYVFFGNAFYYVDVTFDDPVYSGNSTGKDRIMHNWFFVTTEEIERNRRVTYEGYCPVCDKIVYNYYYQKGLFFRTFDIDLIKESVFTVDPRKGIEMKFGNQAAFEKAIGELIQNRRWCEIIQAKQIVYNTDSLFFVIDILGRK